MEIREKYQGKIEAILREWRAEIDKMTSSVDKAAIDTKHGFHDQFEAFSAQKVSIQEKPQALGTSSDNYCEDLKEGLDQSWNQVKDSYNKAVAKFK